MGKTMRPNQKEKRTQRRKSAKHRKEKSLRILPRSASFGNYGCGAECVSASLRESLCFFCNDYLCKSPLLVFCLAGMLVETGFTQPQKHIPSDQRGDLTLRAYSNVDGNNGRSTATVNPCSLQNMGIGSITRKTPDSIKLNLKI